MASVKGSDNPFPSILVVESAAPATPAAGRVRLFVDVADGLLKWKDDAGVVTAVGGDATAHIADATAAHAATAVAFTPAAGIAATTVQAAIEEDAGDLAAHLADASAAHAASAVGFTPNGSIAATDVQAAIQEVRDEAAVGGGLSYVETALTAPITMVAAGTFYDGPAVTLSAGTWLVMATMTGFLPGAASNVVMKIWDGTTVGASCQATGSSGWSWRTNAQCVVVIASGTPTWKASVACDSITGVDGGVFDTLSLYGAGDTASIITAVKIA